MVAVGVEGLADDDEHVRVIGALLAGGLDQGEGLLGPVAGEEELGVAAVKAAGDVAAVVEGGAEQLLGHLVVAGGGVVFGPYCTRLAAYPGTSGSVVDPHPRQVIKQT